MEKSRPRVILSAAMSLDGKIATKTGDSELSSKQDKVRIHILRSKVDAILVGSNTVKRDDPLLTVRYVKGKNPLRIVLDSKATIKQKYFQTKETSTRDNSNRQKSSKHQKSFEVSIKEKN